MIRIRGLLALLILNGCAPSVESPQSASGRMPSTSPTSEVRIEQLVEQPVEQVSSSVTLNYELTSLLQLIRSRLEIMPGVAKAKWNAQLPVTDPRREEALLAQVTSDGVALGLPEDLVRQVFLGQIKAAKLIQEQLFTEWKKSEQSPFSSVPDLKQTVRPQIDDLNRKLLTALVKCQRLQRLQSRDDWLANLSQARDQVFATTEWSVDVIDTALLPLFDGFYSPE